MCLKRAFTTLRNGESRVQKMGWKMKVALGFLGMLTIYSLPLFSLMLGAAFVLYLNRQEAA